MPFVKALKNFQGTPDEGGFVTRGSEIEVTDERHRALAKNGLVTPPDGDDAAAKRAPDPQNKMQAEPDNKAVTHASMQTKRVPLNDPQAAEKLAEQAPKLLLDNPAAAAEAIVENSRPLAGGPTGADIAPSSSPQVRRPRARTSRSSGDASKS